MTAAGAKIWLRAVARRRRERFSTAQRRRLSQTLTKRLLTLPEFRRARTVAIYLSFGSEVETQFLRQACERLKKDVVVPVCPEKLSDSYFVLLPPRSKTEPTRYGPHEPLRPWRRFPLEKINFMVVPGLAWDEHGHRTGYGGGVYDRFIARTPGATHVGIFLENQRLNGVPREPHDHALNLVVTEERTLRFTAGK